MRKFDKVCFKLIASSITTVVQLGKRTSPLYLFSACAEFQNKLHNVKVHMSVWQSLHFLTEFVIYPSRLKFSFIQNWGNMRWQNGSTIAQKKRFTSAVNTDKMWTYLSWPIHWKKWTRNNLFSTNCRLHNRAPYMSKCETFVYTEKFHYIYIYISNVKANLKLYFYWSKHFLMCMKQGKRKVSELKDSLLTSHFVPKNEIIHFKLRSIFRQAFKLSWRSSSHGIFLLPNTVMYKFLLRS